jgi:hypothetical protein
MRLMSMGPLARTSGRGKGYGQDRRRNLNNPNLNETP